MDINTNRSNIPPPMTKPVFPPMQYVSEYDTNGYSPNQIPIRSLPFAQSSVGRDPYHMSFAPTTHTNSTQNLHSVNGTSRVRSEANRFMSSQVTNQEVVKGNNVLIEVKVE